MPRPVVSQAAEDLYTILSPLAFDDEALDWPLLNYCESIAGALQEVVDYGSDWSQVVDIDRVPYEAIPWLGQLVGVVTPPIATGETESEHEDRIREYVRGTPGFSRGTPAAIIQAAQQYLTGTKTVILRERNSGAYKLGILTWTTETPSEDWEQTNLVPNSSAETNLANIPATAGTGVSRVTTQHYHGAYGVEVSTPGSGIGEGVGFQTLNSSIIADSYYSYSVMVNAPVGSQLGLRAYHTNDAGGFLMYSESPIIVGTGSWQRMVMENVLSDLLPATHKVQLQIVTLGTSQVITFWADAAQVEPGSVATTYIPTDGAIASRPAGQGPVGAAILSQKPAGIILTYDALVGQDYQLVFTNHPDYQDVYNDYPTYQGMFIATPGI